jgi:hypothetical protein
MSMYWNVCLMTVTGTETCSSFTLLKILLCVGWTSFNLVLQHNGLLLRNFEVATLRTNNYEVRGSNFDHGTGYNITSNGFVNLHNPSRKIDSPHSTLLFLPNYFLFLIHPPYIHTILLNCEYSTLQWTRIYTNTSEVAGCRYSLTEGAVRVNVSWAVS